MLVRRKVWAVLLATVLLATFMSAVPALAGCPAGTIDLSNPNNYVSEVAGAPIDNTVSPAKLTEEGGVYCVPTGGIVLGGVAPGLVGVNALPLPGLALYPDELKVEADDISIVGESPCAKLTGSPAATTGIIINRGPGYENLVVNNLTIEDGNGPVGIGITDFGENTIIKGVTFLGDFVVTAIRVEGDGTKIQNSIFDMQKGECIRLIGGEGIDIVDNKIYGSLNLNQPWWFVFNVQNQAEDVTIKDNTVYGGLWVFIGQLSPLDTHGFSKESRIEGNKADCGYIGIELGNSNDTKVIENTISYGYNSQGYGIVDSGGSDNEYRGNTITASSSATSLSLDGIKFVSDQTKVIGNTIDARGSDNSCGDGIDATGYGPYHSAYVPGWGGAEEAIIIENTVLGTSCDLSNPSCWGAPYGPSGGYGIRMDHPDCGDFVVIGNTIQNTATAGIVAVTLRGAAVGGDGHRIGDNTISHTGTKLFESAPPNWLQFPFGTAISTNGDCIVGGFVYLDQEIPGNSISYVKAGYGIFSRGDKDMIGGDTDKNGNQVRYLSDSYGSGIYVEEGTSDTTITHNTVDNITGIYANGIGIAGDKCIIEKNRITTVTGQDGIRIYDSAYIAQTGPATTPPGDQNILDNTISDIPNGVGINLTDSDKNTVTGNTIEDTGREGILLYAVPGIALSNYPGVGWVRFPDPPGDDPIAEDNVVQKNTITDAGRHAGNVDSDLGNMVRSQRYAAIGLIGDVDENEIGHLTDDSLGNTVTNAGSKSYAVGILLTTDGLGVPDENTVGRNQITGFGHVSDTAVVSDGIRLVFGEGNKIAGNQVSNSGNLQCGISVLTGKKDTIISDNWVEGMQQAGLYLSGGSPGNPVKVEKNKLVNNARGIWMNYGAANVTSCNLIVGGSEALYVDPAADAARFTISGNCIGTCVLIRNMDIGTLDARGNYWASDPEPNVNVFGKADYAVPGDPSWKTTCSCKDWESVLASAATACCGYEPGWNLVSVPITPSSTGTSAVFGQYAAGLREYNTATQKFIKPSTVNWEKGYWLLMTSKQMLCFQGSLVTGEQTITLAKAGWHLIGVPFPCKWEKTVINDGSSLVLGPIGWDALVQDWVVYALDATLYPCMGYWVLTEQNNVKLTFPYPQPGLPGSSTASVLPLSALPNGMTPPLPPGIPGLTYEAVDNLVFTSFPNPVTDVNTVHFQVNGAAEASVEAVKLEIYDASGALVYSSGEISDTGFDWHTDNRYGDYLPNGVYSYRMYAKLNGQWVVSGVEAVVILR